MGPGRMEANLGLVVNSFVKKSRQFFNRENVALCEEHWTTILWTQYKGKNCEVFPTGRTCSERRKPVTC